MSDKLLSVLNRGKLHGFEGARSSHTNSAVSRRICIFFKGSMTWLFNHKKIMRPLEIFAAKKLIFGLIYADLWHDL